MQSYFDELEQVRYEGSQSTNPLAFHHYNPDEIILGKRMADHLRFAACYWHTFCWGGAAVVDVVGAGVVVVVVVVGVGGSTVCGTAGKCTPW